MFPAATSAVILFAIIFIAVSPYRPQWTKPFVEENERIPRDTPLLEKARVGPSARALFLLLWFGFILRVVAALYPILNVETSLAATPWVGHPWQSFECDDLLNACRP